MTLDVLLSQFWVSSFDLYIRDDVISILSLFVDFKKLIKQLIERLFWMVDETNVHMGPWQKLSYPYTIVKCMIEWFYVIITFMATTKKCVKKVSLFKRNVELSNILLYRLILRTTDKVLSSSEFSVFDDIMTRFYDAITSLLLHHN